jgi:hypothetical protein
MEAARRRWRIGASSVRPANWPPVAGCGQRIVPRSSPPRRRAPACRGLQAAAITRTFGRDEAILRALEARNDLLLFANQQVYDPTLVPRVVKLVAAAVASGRIPQSRIDEAFDRVRKLFGATADDRPRCVASQIRVGLTSAFGSLPAPKTTKRLSSSGRIPVIKAPLNVGSSGSRLQVAPSSADRHAAAVV